MSNEWTYGFCAVPPLDLCCESCFCPWFVFGRTHERNQGRHDADCVNNACLVFAVGCAFGVWPLILCVERERIRHQYGIRGGPCGDFWGSACCIGNVLVQSERESLARSAPPVPPPQPYQTVNGMRYAAQPDPPRQGPYH